MDGFGDLAAAAEGEAVDGGNDWFSERLQPRGHRLAAANEVAHRCVRAESNAAGKFLDVGAG